MKRKNIALLLAGFIGAGFLAACSPDSGDEGPAIQQEEEPASESDAANGEAVDATAQGDSVQIEVTGNDQMRFEPAEISVPAGSEVTIVFRNVGTMPKESMGHNLIVLQRKVNPTEFAQAGATHADNSYVDPNLDEQIVAGTNILGPGESEEITFTAPSDSGENPFVCTFPGHALAGMVGVLKVE